MYSLLHLRDLIHGRLTAAAEDIFTHVERIVVEYVEEEVDRQRRQLAFVCKPKVKLQRKDLPQQKFNEEEEEGQTEQQLCNQGRKPSLDQEEPEFLHIKEEEEADTFMLTPDNEESDHMEPDTDPQLLSAVAQSHDQTEIYPGEDNVALYVEGVDPKRRQLQQKELLQHHVYSEEKVLTEQEGNSNVDHEEPEYLQIKEEEICTSQEQLELKQESDTFVLTPDNEESDHMEPDTDHQLLSAVAESRDQGIHKRTITGEKPHMCNICKKCFAGKGTLINHQRTHTGEKPFYCETCGKCFSVRSTLSRHKNIHTHVKPHMCNVCKKCFRYIRNLIDHKRIHTGEKPYSCGTCGKTFRQNSHLMNHTRTHTGEKPHVCNICKRRFARKDTLLKHENSHR